MARALRMRWIDLAFLHWPIPASTMRLLVPHTLEVDTFRDTAWIGITPFRMTRVRPVLLPPVPTASDFPELNVRTYVRHRERSGVYFLSLDAASRLAVETARATTGLPYYRADMRERRVKDEIHFSSRRAGARSTEFRARYRPTGGVFTSNSDSLEYWLTERYSLFVTRSDVLIRLDIEHAPWPLQPASVDIEVNTMAPAGVELPAEKPHALFSRQLDVVAHWPVPAT